MTDPRACKVCPFLRPENSLSLKRVWEYERLDRLLRKGKAGPLDALRYYWLHERRYFPPCDLERMGAA